MRSIEEWEQGTKNEKFRWIELSLVGVTAGIILLTQGLKSWFIFLALICFILLAIYETIGIFVVKFWSVVDLRNSKKDKIFVEYSILFEVALLSIAFVLLAIGSYLLFMNN